MQKYDYARLRGKIREKHGSEKSFARALGVSAATLSSKLCGHIGFTQGEIERSASLLGIGKELIADYFLDRAQG